MVTIFKDPVLLCNTTTSQDTHHSVYFSLPSHSTAAHNSLIRFTSVCTVECKGQCSCLANTAHQHMWCYGPCTLTRQYSFGHNMVSTCGMPHHTSHPLMSDFQVLDVSCKCSAAYYDRMLRAFLQPAFLSLYTSHHKYRQTSATRGLLLPPYHKITLQLHYFLPVDTDATPVHSHHSTLLVWYECSGYHSRSRLMASSLPHM